MLNYIKFLDKRKILYYNNIVSAVKIFSAGGRILKKCPLPFIEAAFTLSLQAVFRISLRIAEVYIYYEPSVPFLFGRSVFGILLLAYLKIYVFGKNYFKQGTFPKQAVYLIFMSFTDLRSDYHIFSIMKRRFFCCSMPFMWSYLLWLRLFRALSALRRA